MNILVMKLGAFSCVLVVSFSVASTFLISVLGIAILFVVSTVFAFASIINLFVLVVHGFFLFFTCIVTCVRTIVLTWDSTDKDAAILRWWPNSVPSR